LFRPNVWEYVTHVYYIRRISANDLRLYRKTLRMGTGGMGMVSEEVAAGIENMRLLFGLDTDNDNIVDRYVGAEDSLLATPVFWEQALTAQVYLLVRGENELTKRSDDRTYTLGDIELQTPNDKRHRRMVSTTITLRNPMLRRKMTPAVGELPGGSI
jgi:type IV pilus assembly protein PilW